MGVPRAAEIGGGKRGHVIGDTELGGGLGESGEALADVGEELGVRAGGGGAGDDLVVVQIPAADAREENLAAQAERGRDGGEAGDHAELLAEICFREIGFEGDFLGEHGGEERAVGGGIGVIGIGDLRRSGACGRGGAKGGEAEEGRSEAKTCERARKVSWG